MKIVTVSQGSRYSAKKALREAKVVITREGYTDSSTTTWGFIVRTTKSCSKLQDILWASGESWVGADSVGKNHPWAQDIGRRY